MDVLRMLSELRAERDQLEEAIITIQRLAAGQGKRRGRPPAWMKSETDVATPRKRKAFTAATRKKMAAAQKARWAAKKAG